MWHFSSRRTWRPSEATNFMAMVLPMVPEGTKRAASFPRSSAAFSWSLLTVGSSPKRSSPTSASAMAFLILSVGRVTVSLRKSDQPLYPMDSSRLFRALSTSPPLYKERGCTGKELREKGGKYGLGVDKAFSFLYDCEELF